MREIGKQVDQKCDYLMKHEVAGDVEACLMLDALKPYITSIEMIATARETKFTINNIKVKFVENGRFVKLPNDGWQQVWTLNGVVHLIKENL